MATLEKIRNRAGLLVAIVIGLALLAFILGDFLNTGGMPMQGDQFEVAEINGESIHFREYDQKVQKLEKISNMYSQQQSMDEESLKRVRQQAWDQLTRERVLAELYEELGISVNADEVFDMVQGDNIHPFVRQLFADPETGRVNQAAIIQFLRNMDQDPSGRQKEYWLFMEQEMIRERKFTKYNNLISKGLYVPEKLAEQQARENARKVNFSFVMQRFTEIDDSLVEVSRRDIKNYYNGHKENFKQEEGRDVEYVAFRVTPSKADDQAAERWINEIAPEFEEVQDNKDFVNLNSDVPYQDKYLKEEEVPETIREFIWNAEPGDMYGPYYENKSYKLAKLDKIDYRPDSVRARHILIEAGQNAQSAKQAVATADSLMEELKAGANFAQLARQYSADQASAAEGGDLGWFQTGQMVKPFNDTAFEAAVNELKKVQSQYGVHIMQVLERGKEVKKVKIAVLERIVTPSTETFQDYYTQASEFAGKHRNYDDFIEAIEEEGLTKRVANNLKRSDRSIAGFEESPMELVRWAYGGDKNDVSGVMEIGDNYVVAALADVREEGYAEIERVKEDIITEVKKEKKAGKLKEKINEVLTNATDINQLAAELGTEVKTATNISFNSFSVPGAGIEPKLVAAATSLPENKVSKPIAGNNGVYVLEVTGIQKAGEIAVESQQMTLQRRYQSRARYEAYETIKELANIKDYRYKFY